VGCVGWGGVAVLRKAGRTRGSDPRDNARKARKERANFRLDANHRYQRTLKPRTRQDRKKKWKFPKASLLRRSMGAGVFVEAVGATSQLSGTKTELPQLRQKLTATSQGYRQMLLFESRGREVNQDPAYPETRFSRLGDENSKYLTFRTQP
jgi:hypothetical protein